MQSNDPIYIKACQQVADDWRKLARAIRAEDAYASHVPDEVKEAKMLRMLNDAEAIERGIVESFTIAQRVHEKITGKCVALLA